MKLELEHTTVFTKTFEAMNNDNVRFIVQQGGSRSSKSYSICQVLLVWALTKPNQVISIIRKSFPSLRGSIMRDMIGIMKDLNIYSEKNHNKTENYYQFSNGSMIEFFAADDEQKLRGRKRDIAFCNEANELSREEYTQLNLRTTDKLIFDFNPSDSHHWLYDIQSRSECILIKSTYKDNPFLSKAQINEMEELKNIDEGYYRVYALGERGVTKTTIYSHYKNYEELPEIKETVYGLDFGFNHPSALVECNFIDNKVYVKELIYARALTSKDLIGELDRLNINKNKDIICDNARPEIIEELKRFGYLAKPAIKEVKAGIDSVKTSELFIHKESLNLLKELTSYMWKSNGDIIYDEPVKVWDDLVDAMRYAIHWWKIKNRSYSIDNFRFY